jgi:RNA polymerase sigma-70 factor (ECF subfamily)
MPNRTQDIDLPSLLERVKLADQGAVEVLYRHFYSSVYAFVRMQIDDLGAVDEIVDDVFMVVFKSVADFRGQANFKTWVMGIAKNLCYNWLRKMSREPSLQHFSTEHQLDALIDQDLPVLDQLERHEIQTIIKLCMDRLPAHHRETLFWVYFEDMTLSQVAQAMKCATGTIKSRLFHAKLKMADCVTRRLTDTG